MITQPLYKDCFVPSIAIQVAIYSDIIERALSEYKKIYIKAHPRDDYDYGSTFVNVSIIDRKIPTEVLNFENKILFDKAITINSTAIYQMDFVNKKEILGLDYIKRFMTKFFLFSILLSLKIFATKSESLSVLSITVSIYSSRIFSGKSLSFNAVV